LEFEKYLLQMLGVASDMCQVLAKFENAVITSFNFISSHLPTILFGACKQWNGSSLTMF